MPVHRKLVKCVAEAKNCSDTYCVDEEESKKAFFDRLPIDPRFSVTVQKPT